MYTALFLFMTSGKTILLLLLLSIIMQGCELIGDIFEAGFYTALFIVFVMIMLILFLIGYFRRK